MKRYFVSRPNFFQLVLFLIPYIAMPPKRKAATTARRTSTRAKKTKHDSSEEEDDVEQSSSGEDEVVETKTKASKREETSSDSKRPKRAASTAKSDAKSSAEKGLLFYSFHDCIRIFTSRDIIQIAFSLHLTIECLSCYFQYVISFLQSRAMFIVINSKPFIFNVLGNFGLKWHFDDTLYILDSQEIKGNTKFIGFDMVNRKFD